MTEVRQGPTSHVHFREVSAKRELTEQAFLALAGSYRAKNVPVSVLRKPKKPKVLCGCMWFQFCYFPARPLQPWMRSRWFVWKISSRKGRRISQTMTLPKYARSFVSISLRYVRIDIIVSWYTSNTWNKSKKTGLLLQVWCWKRLDQRHGDAPGDSRLLHYGVSIG